MREPRVTARIRRTPDGNIQNEYVVGNLAFGDIEAVRDHLGRVEA
jgi:hypothetical protein